MMYDFSNIASLEGVTNVYSNPIDTNILNQVLDRHNLSRDIDVFYLWQDDKSISSTLITPNFISLIDTEGNNYPYYYNEFEKLVFTEEADNFGFKCIAADNNINGYFSWQYLGLSDSLSTSNINNGHHIATQINNFINHWKYKNEFFNITIGQADKKLIFSEIQALIIELDREDSLFTRRELVNHLNNKFPHLNLLESIEINKLLKEFYDSVSYSNTLRKSVTERFMNDEFTSYLYNSEKVSLQPTAFSLENEKAVFEELDKAFQIVDSSYTKISNSDPIYDLQRIESELKNIKAEEVFFSLTGKSRVEEKYKEAVKVYENYQNLIQRYGIIKNEILNTFSDFEQIRNFLKFIREDLMNFITDFYGDNLKKTNPELFDFDSVKWMQFDQISDNLNLSFNSINNTCQNFFEYYNATGNDLGNYALGKLETLSNTKYNKQKAKEALLDVGITALFTVFDTNEKSNNTISQFNYEIELMKKDFMNDSGNIRMDVIRLLEIFKNLREDFIPGTRTFIKGLQILSDGELKRDFETVIKIPGIKELKDERDKLLKESRTIESFHYDTIEVIKNATENRQYYQGEIDKIQSDYDFAIDNEPIEPSYWVNFLSIRIAKKIYLKTHHQWDVKTYDLRSNYSNLCENHNIENIRINSNENRINRFEIRQTEIQNELATNKIKIQSILGAENEIREVLRKNIMDIAKLTQQAKKVLESKLDESLLSVSNSF